MCPDLTAVFSFNLFLNVFFLLLILTDFFSMFYQFINRISQILKTSAFFSEKHHLFSFTHTHTLIHSHYCNEVVAMQKAVAEILYALNKLLCLLGPIIII